jgi:short subunit dehydrogenase-like uncharacterized protein
MKAKILVYGVLGYTGNLFLEHALDQSLPIVLGARENTLKHVAQKFGLEHRIFDIDTRQNVIPHLSDVKAVVNLANISYGVNRYLIDACIQTKTHYVDLAAEYPDIIEIYKLHDAALSEGVMLMPGAGFNLVTTDIAGRIASSLLVDSTKLSLGFATFGTASRGTIKSVLRLATANGYSRVAGALVAAKPASKELAFRAEGKAYPLINNPVMGDVITSFISTKIPNITAYSYYPWILVQFMKGRMNWLRRFLLTYAHWFFPVGPSGDELARQHTYSWAQVENNRSEKLTVLIKGPQAYLFTVKAIGRILGQIAQDKANAGFTPPSFFGRDLIEGIEGVQISVVRESN